MTMNERFKDVLGLTFEGPWKRVGVPLRSDDLVDFGLHPTLKSAVSGQHPLTAEMFADCTQRRYEFPNGYKASVVTGKVITAWADYELAVMHPHVSGCVYDTPVTNDVERGDAKHMNKLLEHIASLPPRIGCALPGRT